MAETRDTPIIFLAYANRERADSVEALREENHRIGEILRPMEEKRACTILEENPEDNVLFWDLAQQPNYRDRIQVVHIAGGRPGRKYLRMLSAEGEKALEADEFADFFAQLPNLNLIFITGSANPRIVRRLLIKSSASVIRLENDDQNEGAVYEFYSQLAKGFVVKRAFGQTTISCGDHLMYEILTMAELTAPPFQRRDIFEGLYVRNDHTTSLEWKLSPSFYLSMDEQQGAHGEGGERPPREEDISPVRPWLKPILAGIISFIGVGLLLLTLFSDLPNRWVNQLTGSSVCPFPQEDNAYNVLVLPFYVEESCRRVPNSYRSSVKSTLQQFKDEGGIPINVQYHDAQCPTSEFFANSLGGTCNADLLIWATRIDEESNSDSYQVNFTSTDSYEEVQLIEERGNPARIQASSPEVFQEALQGRLQEIVRWSQGMKRFREENYAEAINFFELVRDQIGNNSASCDRLIARCYAQDGNYAQALQYFGSALTLKDQDPSLWLERGKVYLETQAFEEARKDFQKARELRPSNAEVYMAFGAMFQKLSQPDSALNAFDQAIRVNPDHIDAYLSRADQHRAMGHIDEAFADYSHCVRNAPNRSEPYRGIGDLYEGSNNYQEAIRYYSRALNANPKDAEALFSRGVLHGRYSRYDKALIDLSDAIDINPEVGKYYSHSAMIYKNLEEDSLALQYARRGVALSPESPLAYALRGQVYTFTKDFTLAGNDFDEALRLDERCAEAYFGRGLLNDVLGNTDKALAELKNAIRIDPRMAFAYCKLGEIYKNERPGSEKLAMDNFNKAIEADQGLSYAYELRADLHVDLGNLEEALSDNSIAISQNNGRPGPYSNRAGIFFAMGNMEEARKDVQRAIELSKGGEAMHFYLLTKIYASQRNDSLFFKNLELALEKRIPAEEFEDPTFNAFRNDDRFQRLVGEF